MQDHAIQQLLRDIESRHGVRILHACESGSRAWGFASADSDYDIRFLFVRPENDYLSLQEHADTIEIPIEGDLDAGGWDLKKAARLLAKSNGALIEWLHSPVIYREDPAFLTRWREAAKSVFSVRASADHYRGLAKQMLRGKLAGDNARAKDYLYALRALLCAKWVSSGLGIPPVAFAELVPSIPPEIQPIIATLLADKAETREHDRIPRIPALDDFLNEEMEAMEMAIGNLPDTTNPLDVLDPLFLREIRRNPVTTRMRVADFTLDRVRQTDLLLFDAVAGSVAYGTNLASSDEDRRGIFVAPKDFLLGLETIAQVSDERSDHVYYEIGRFISLLLKNNPNALELLAMPEDCIRSRHPAFSLLCPGDFLSKLCARTFGEYAIGQIHKARGLNKKIVNPEPEARKSLLEFCHVPVGQGSMPVLAWLDTQGLDARHCGLTAVAHATGLHAIYLGMEGQYRGLVSPKNPDALLFSSVPHEARPIAWMYANLDAFKAHCKAHTEYWNWVETRNEERYQTNSSHDRGYDSKNVMHTFRLLDMALEIAREGVLRVRRPNREFLLSIRAGNHAYGELIEMAETKLQEVQAAFKGSSLPDIPDEQHVEEVLLDIRHGF